MGWEPSTTTTYTYDWRGRVKSVTTTPEPEYTEHDRLVILAQRREEQRPRGSHGILLSEATDPANANKFKVEGPTTDFAAQTLHKAQEKYRKEWGEDVDYDSHLWSIELPD